MTPLDRRLRPWSGRDEFSPDDPLVRQLRGVVGGVEPDPLFVRRLRGRVLNEHVAISEGLLQPTERREMGRLGRAVLMASLALAVSVGGAAATSQEALPGDLLYPMKLQIEEIRLRVAPPGVHEHLEVAQLDERLRELERLVAAGRWDGVRDAAAALERSVAVVSADPAATGVLAERTEVLEELLTAVPEEGRGGIKRALEAAQGNGAPATAPQRPAWAGVPHAHATPAAASNATRPSDRPNPSHTPPAYGR
jgi:hypothetical protein